MHKLTFDEITDGYEFENLVESYLRNLPNTKVTNSGKGSDGGVDIFLKIEVNDAIKVFTRKWIVQCKFHKKTIGKADISDVNIPTLIHEHKADGYLLVCRREINSRLSDSFRNLRENCKFGYDYEIWTGSQLKDRIILDDKVIQKYFPNYWGLREAKK
jgi:hypothetical protein